MLLQKLIQADTTLIVELKGWKERNGREKGREKERKEERKRERKEERKRG